MQIDRPITIALILFTILLLVFFLVAPEYKTFGKLQTELGLKKAEFNAEYAYYDAIAKTYADLQGHKEDIAKIDNALPQDSNLGKLIYFFQQTATTNGMMIKDLALAKSATNAGQNSLQKGAGSPVKDIIFSVDLLGNYPSLEKFIISLEKSARIFEITNISFGSAGSNAPTPIPAPQSQFQTQQTYSFNLQIRTHTY